MINISKRKDPNDDDRGYQQTRPQLQQPKKVKRNGDTVRKLVKACIEKHVTGSSWDGYRVIEPENSALPVYDDLRAVHLQYMRKFLTNARCTFDSVTGLWTPIDKDLNAYVKNKDACDQELKQLEDNKKVIYVHNQCCTLDLLDNDGDFLKMDWTRFEKKPKARQALFDWICQEDPAFKGTEECELRLDDFEIRLLFQVYNSIMLFKFKDVICTESAIPEEIAKHL